MTLLYLRKYIFWMSILILIVCDISDSKSWQTNTYEEKYIVYREMGGGWDAKVRVTELIQVSPTNWRILDYILSGKQKNLSNTREKWIKGGEEGIEPPVWEWSIVQSSKGNIQGSLAVKLHNLVTDLLSDSVSESGRFEVSLQGSGFILNLKNDRECVNVIKPHPVTVGLFTPQRVEQYLNVMSPTSDERAYIELDEIIINNLRQSRDHSDRFVTQVVLLLAKISEARVFFEYPSTGVQEIVIEAIRQFQTSLNISIRGDLTDDQKTILRQITAVLKGITTNRIRIHINFDGTGDIDVKSSGDVLPQYMIDQIGALVESIKGGQTPIRIEIDSKFKPFETDGYEPVDDADGDNDDQGHDTDHRDRKDKDNKKNKSGK